MGRCPPTRSPAHAPLPKHIPYHHFCHLLVDCWLQSSNGGHLRPRPRPSFYFLMGLFSATQTREQTMASANPTSCAFPRLIGRGGTTSWVRGGCCHGDRGQSRRRVRRRRLMLVVVCCGCGCKNRFSYLTGRKVKIGPAKMAHFFAFITKNASLDAPNVKGCRKLSLFLDFGHISTFGLKGETGAL